jgi:hypothetical protein
MQFLVRLGKKGDEPSTTKTPKASSPKNILHQNKTKEKTNAIAGWAPMTTTMMTSQRLILGVMAGVVGLLQSLQDDVHCPQDVAGRARILGDPGDKGHTKIL